MTPVRLGLIGCGSIGRSAHLPAIARLADQVRLQATADTSEAVAEAAARPWGADHYTDYRAILERKDIDAVVIATPEYLHAEQVVAAAAAGKHVLCEKPIASSLAEADRMIEACRSAGVHLLIGHSRRFTRRYMQIRAALDRGAIGTVRLIRENERRTRAHLDQAGVRWTPKHWTGNVELQKGVALSHAIHEADLFRWFSGSEADYVFAEHAVTTEGNIGVPDFMTFTIRFANGTMASSEVSNSPPPGYPAFHQIELYGSDGAIRAKDHDMIGLFRYGEAGTEFPGSFGMLLHNVTSYTRQLAELIGAICDDRPVHMAPSHARAALEIALSALEFSQNRARHSPRVGGSEAMNETIPVGVVGANRYAHALLQQNAPLTKIQLMRWSASPGDHDGEQAGKLAASAGAGMARSWRDITADPNLPAILVVSDALDKYEVAIAGLTAGKIVLCPTPAAHDFKDLEDLAKAQSKGGGTLLSGGEIARTEAGSRALREIRTVEFGVLRSLYLGIRQPCSTGRSTRDVIEDLGWEALDAVLAAVRGRIRYVTSISGHLFGPGSVHDTAVIVMRCDDGCIVTVDLARCLPQAAPAMGLGQIDMEAIGSRGVVRVAPNAACVDIRGKGTIDVVPCLDEPVISMLDDVVACHEGRLVARNDIEQQRDALRVMQAVRASSQDVCRVDLEAVAAGP